MLINPPYPQLQTEIFSLIFFSVILFNLKKSPPEFNLTKNITDELKGVSILMILFGHMGYFLSLNHTFLYPLSISSGVGVNLFLFLSGFGLTKSSIHNKLSIVNYYKKRIPRLFLSLWVILTIFYLLDFLVLKKSYPLNLTFQSFLGIFPQSDIHSGLNSPLWYFTLMLFYYLLFPLSFIKFLKYFSPLILYGASLVILKYPLPVTHATLDLYSLHTMAFPLGVFFGLLNLYLVKLNLKEILILITPSIQFSFLRYFLISLGLVIFAYFSIYSGVGTDKHLEQVTSIFLMLILTAVFLITGLKIKFLGIYGKYSYGIYLIHWPLIYRYDFLYKSLPAFLATFFYLFILLLLAYFLEKYTRYKLQTVGNKLASFSKTFHRIK